MSNAQNSDPVLVPNEASLQGKKLIVNGGEDFFAERCAEPPPTFPT